MPCGAPAALFAITLKILGIHEIAGTSRELDGTEANDRPIAPLLRVAASWDPELTPTLQTRGAAMHAVQLIDRLLADLAVNRAGNG